jgi:hypothetical protein
LLATAKMGGKDLAPLENFSDKEVVGLSGKKKAAILMTMYYFQTGYDHYINVYAPVYVQQTLDRLLTNVFTP